MDELLIDRLRRGDRHAADALVERHLDDLYRFLRHLTRHAQEAEDLAQRTLLRALRGIGGFDGQSSLRTWLHRIAYREFLNWRRGRRLVVALDPRRPHVDPGYDAFESRERLVDAIGRLSPKVGAAFLLVEVQELTIEEAAQALRVPAGTIKSRLDQARHRLRRLLAEPAPENAHAPEPL